jgi:2'-hydroxyisoflavone reductase
VSKVLTKGLGYRPLAETVRDTLAWDLARGGPGADGEGLSAVKERQLLAELASRSGASTPRKTR